MLLRDAAAGGHVAAARALAAQYEAGLGVERDEDEAARWYRAAAAAGDQRAQMRLRDVEGSTWRGQALSNSHTRASAANTGFKVTERSIDGVAW